jgi:hypothetical protein
MECFICYETVNDTGDMIRLECLHSLCKRCLGKLEKRLCPYCRTDITVQVTAILYKPLPTKECPVYPSTIRIRVRRRRRRRTRSERLEISSTDQTVVLETLDNVSLTRAFKVGCSDRKKQKYRQSKSGRWNGLNRKRFGRQRVKQGR